MTDQTHNDFAISDVKDKRLLDEIMAHLILAGGRKFTPCELASLRLGELLSLCTPNGIRFHVRQRSTPTEQDKVEVPIDASLCVRSRDETKRLKDVEVRARALIDFLYPLDSYGHPNWMGTYWLQAKPNGYKFLQLSAELQRVATPMFLG